LREADYYERADGGIAHCLLCPQDCHIRPGKTGLCGVRENRDGVLRALKYGRCATYALDPIEKKPLYHFHPGAYVFSLAAFGCNLRCRHCQNWELSQGDGPDMALTPEQAVARALLWKGRDDRCVGLAYTYSEPMVWMEMVQDTARIARGQGFKNVLITNGFVNEKPLGDLLPLIDALNVDVKAFTDTFYRDVCGGRLAPVLRTVEMAHQAGSHVEVTALLVTGLNDGAEEIGRLVEWLAGLSPDIPLHFSRYFPSYKMTRPATPMAGLTQAREIASRRLHYVYVGNAWEIDASETLCPWCGAIVVRRRGYVADLSGLSGTKCGSCAHDLAFRRDPH
jgi:pyruvate formate lyase activating enzyme